MSAPEVIATFTDQFGEERKIRRVRGRRVQIQNATQTPFLRLTPAIAAHIGQQVRERRIAMGISMEDLAIRCGMTGGKQRVYAVEKATRGHGVKLGTLYAIAFVLQCEVTDLLPSVELAMRAASDVVVLAPRLAVAR